MGSREESKRGSNALGTYRFVSIGRWVRLGCPPACWVVEGLDCFFPRSMLGLAACLANVRPYWRLVALNRLGALEVLTLGPAARMRLVGLLGEPEGRDGVSETRCPFDGEEMTTYTYDQGSHWAVCGTCLMEGPSRPTPEEALEAAGRMCVVDDRPRLPTLEEEAAHLAKHGEKAGWSVIIDEGPRGLGDDLRTWQTWAPERIAIWRVLIEAPMPKGIGPSWRLRARPEVDGRPVAGPEGW